MPGERKREALIGLYEQRGQDSDPRYGNRAKTAALAGEIAALIGYHAGTARRELARYIADQPGSVAHPEPKPATSQGPEPDAGTSRSREEPGQPGPDPDAEATA